MAAHHGRRISSLSVTYQEEYHRPHSARKHTNVKHHPFAKLASGPDKISKPKKNYSQLAKVPSTTVHHSNPVKTTLSNSSSCVAVPVPQLPEDQTLNEACEEFCGDLTDILQDQKDSTASLYPPISYYHPPVPQSLSNNTTLTPVQRLTPSSSITQQSQQTLHPHFICNGTEQLGVSMFVPSSGAVANPSYIDDSIDTCTMPCTPQTTASSSTAATVPPPPSSVSWAPSVYQLYGIEDQLRHKINVEIENFRMLVQQTLCEQFHQYRAQHPTTYEQVDQHSQHNEVPSQFGGNVDSQNGYEKTSTELIRQVASDQEETEAAENELLDSHQEMLEGSNSTCSSVYSNTEMSITGDSGVELCVYEAPPGSTAAVEQQIDSCLIQLQTYSLAMTNILSKRAEYSVL